MGFRARPFLPSVGLLYRIFCSGAFHWIDCNLEEWASWLEVLLVQFGYLHPLLSQVSNLHHFLKAFSTQSSFFPLYLSQALPPNEVPALLISYQHLLPRPPERTQEWSEKAGSKIGFGICITHYLACSKNLSCVRM